MTWDKALFNYDGMYLSYGPDRQFVARFKYKGAPVTKAIFVKQLIKTTTPDEYFTELKNGKAPLKILIDRDPVWHDAVIEKWTNRKKLKRFDNRSSYRAIQFISANP